MGISYKDSGVDRDLGDKFVDRIKGMIASTYNAQVLSGVGGFASLYKIDEERFLAAGCDGVGTKLKLAQELGVHDTIGQDLVAMCVNDVLCTGARPLFFLDYFASGKLRLEISEAVIKGIVAACKETGTALVGGETAEMPGMYHGEDYDLAGFCVGEVTKQDLLDGSQVREGNDLVALPSSGFHSNGFSLIRKLIENSDRALKLKALTPTKLYVKPVLAALKEATISKRFKINGLSHITGSGFYNVPRINEKFGYLFTELPAAPDFMEQICALSKLEASELYATFNMGVGFVIACENGQELVNFFNSIGQTAILAGKVNGESGVVSIKARGVDVRLQ